MGGLFTGGSESDKLSQGRHSYNQNNVEEDKVATVLGKKTYSKEVNYDDGDHNVKAKIKSEH